MGHTDQHFPRAHQNQNQALITAKVFCKFFIIHFELKHRKQWHEQMYSTGKLLKTDMSHDTIPRVSCIPRLV